MLLIHPLHTKTRSRKAQCRKNRRLPVLFLILPFIVLVVTAQAASITGDPTTDPGWVFQGTSVTNHIDGTGVYTASIYSTAFTLDPSSPLVSNLDGFNWNPGDTIVGVGGTMSPSSDLTYSGGADENGNSHTGATSTRIVVKYGSSTASWTTPGTGSLANGGIGSILLGTYPYDFYPANSGTLIVPADAATEETGPSTTAAISGDMGRVITSWTAGSLTGFESFLDLTLLESTYPSAAIGLGDKFVLDLQRGTGNFQDSLGSLPESLQTVPEPSTWLAGILVVGALAISQCRRLLISRSSLPNRSV